MNKILVNVYVPILGTSYDMFIPPLSPMHQVLELLKKAIAELSDGRFIPSADTAVCSRATGQVLDINRLVWELGIENGSGLMII